MTATAEMKICTGTDAGTESPASGCATNWNLISADLYDETGTYYGIKRIVVPSSGTNYSHERWIRWAFTGVFTLITNVKVYISDWTASSGTLDIKAGETTTGVTPIDTVSTIALTAKTGWDAVGEAIDITPTTPIAASGDKTDYLVTQLSVPSTIITPGDIGTVTLTLTYDES